MDHLVLQELPVSSLVSYLLLSSEVRDSVTLSKSFAHILSLCPQGAFSEECGGWGLDGACLLSTDFQAGHTYVPAGFSSYACCLAHSCFESCPLSFKKSLSFEFLS